MYKIVDKVRLPDTDSAGILFFANYIKLAHIIYEEFISEIGFPLQFVIDKSDFLILIVHTEADYKKSLKLGEKYELSLKVSKIGSRSFTLNYTFYNSDNVVSAEIQTVHVLVNKESMKSKTIPEDLRQALEKYQ